MKRDDTLWKGILENICDDFFRFVFEDAAEIFDFDKGFQFLDKELEQLFPPEKLEAPKFVDKLVKVFTKQGQEQWVLVHIEVQGYYDKDFAKRIFTYFYRILDKYSKPVTAITIYSDTGRNFQPSFYQYEFLGTKNYFQFNTYKIIAQDEAILRQHNNPFAIVVLTVLLAIKNKHPTDQNLFGLKFALAKHLLSRNISKVKTNYILIFLQQYIQFADKEYNVKFDKAIDELTGNQKAMGIKEMVLERARKEGLELGIQEGIKEGIKEGKAEVVKNLISKLGLSDEQISEIADVSPAFIEEVRGKIQN